MKGRRKNKAGKFSNRFYKFNEDWENWWNKHSSVILAFLCVVICAFVLPYYERQDFEDFYAELIIPCAAEESCKKEYRKALNACWDKNRISGRGRKITNYKAMNQCLEAELRHPINYNR